MTPPRQPPATPNNKAQCHHSIKYLPPSSLSSNGIRDFYSNMASKLLRPLLRPQTLGLSLGLSFSAFQFGQGTAMRLDSSPAGFKSRYKRQPQTPILQNGKLNPGAVRQVSSGSILGIKWICHPPPSPASSGHLTLSAKLGLLGGFALSSFSRPLALVIGLLIIAVQVCVIYRCPLFHKSPLTFNSGLQHMV